MIITTTGAKGDDVKKTQAAINKSMAGVQGYVPLVEDGVFGDKTFAAVKQYQAKNGLKSDGQIGDATRGKLFGTVPVVSTPTVAATPKIDVTTKITPSVAKPDTKKSAAELALSQGGYTSALSPDVQTLLDSIKNKSDFTYDPTKDEAFQKYKAQAIDMGQKAYANSVAGASMPGVSTNSVAEQIGQTANTAYLKDANNAEQTFFDKAYQRYQDEQSGDYNKLNAILGVDNNGYGRFVDDKNFDYKAGQDKINNKLNQDQFNLDKTYKTASIDNMNVDNVRQANSGSSSKSSGSSSKSSSSTKSSITDSQYLSKAKEELNAKVQDGYETINGVTKPRMVPKYKTRADYENYLAKLIPDDKLFDDIYNLLGVSDSNFYYDDNIKVNEPIQSNSTYHSGGR